MAYMVQVLRFLSLVFFTQGVFYVMKRIISVLVLVLFVCCGFVQADAPVAVPAKDLISQIPDYIKQLERAIADKEDYEDSKTKIVQKASTLSVIALALGLSEEDHEYKKAAPALLKACQATANSKDYDAAKAGIEAIKKALTDKSGDPSTMKQKKVASMEVLMKVVPLVNTKLKKILPVSKKRAKTLKKNLRGGKRKLKAEGCSAVIAAIAQSSISSADETEKPTEVEAWKKFCIQMRDAAIKTNEMVHAADEEKCREAMTALQKSCDDCHKVFHEVEEESKDDE